MKTTDPRHDHQTFIVAVAVLAIAVMGCGFLSDIEGTTSNPLVGPRWQVRSETLGTRGSSMDAVFNSDGSFTGELNARPGSPMDRDQTIHGTWEMEEPLLLLKYQIVNAVGNYPFTSDVKFSIRMHEISGSRMEGIDEHGRLWIFERRD
jgi:hypothetical protein